MNSQAMMEALSDRVSDAVERHKATLTTAQLAAWNLAGEPVDDPQINRALCDGAAACVDAPDVIKIDHDADYGNPLASKPAPHIGEGDGVSLTRETPRPSPLAGDIHDDQSWPDNDLDFVVRLFAESDAIMTAQSSIPLQASSLSPQAPYYSCRCNVIRRATTSNDQCPTCRKPLSIEYHSGLPLDPNIRVRVVADVISDTIVRLIAIIDDNRPHLTLAAVSRAMATIDEARAGVKLHDLGETPLVMRGDYGTSPLAPFIAARCAHPGSSSASQISNLKSEIASPEGT